MNTSIDSYKLIAAVSKRPALYDKSHKMYYNHNRGKQRLWKETCAEVYPDWEMIPSHKKIEYCREVQKRWKNLRTCFTREVGMQQKEDEDRKNGRGVKPRKVYEYYNRMRFMLSHELKAKLYAIQNNAEAENGNADDNDDPLENMKSEYEPQIPFDKAHDSYDDDDEDDDDDDNIMVIEPEERYASIDGNNDERHVNENAKEDGDDDKHFLMSLLRTFRKLNDKQKYEAKIEILKTLRTIQFPDD